MMCKYVYEINTDSRHEYSRRSWHGVKKERKNTESGQYLNKDLVKCTV